MDDEFDHCPTRNGMDVLFAAGGLLVIAIVLIALVLR